jgi:hypothetical protein
VQCSSEITALNLAAMRSGCMFLYPSRKFEFWRKAGRCRCRHRWKSDDGDQEGEDRISPSSIETWLGVRNERIIVGQDFTDPVDLGLGLGSRFEMRGTSPREGFLVGQLSRIILHFDVGVSVMY